MSPVKIDRTPPPEFGTPPGTYLLEVVECSSEKSKKGQSMLHVEFKVVGGTFNGDDVSDYLILEGKARGIGQNKLKALGIDFSKDFEAYELIGRRAYAAIVQESREYQGKTYTNARIDINAEGSMSGLWPEDAPPPDVGSPDLFDGGPDSTSSLNQDIPF